MNASVSSTGGCGGGHCGCATGANADVPTINGVALHAPGEHLAPDELLARAHGELLRQAAVQRGWLPAVEVGVAPALDADQRNAIEAMIDEESRVPTPDEQACRRHYEAHKPRFVVGQARHVRHILFAVTPGVDVHRLAQHAESALLELTRKDAEPGRFEELARTLSNCPSGAEGGDLGWLTPEACAPELANELFFQRDSAWGMGVHPRLVHSRFGLHIIEVLGRRQGRQPSYEEVADRIAAELSLASRATAWRQFMRVLVGEADIRGMSLDGAASPLVQ